MTSFQTISIHCFLFVFLTSCTISPPQTQKPVPATPQSVESRDPSPPLPTPPVNNVEPPAPAPPTGPKHPLKVRQATLHGTEFTVVTFDRRDFFLAVADQKNGPGSLYDDARAAARGKLAAINGGFFTPEGQPLGLVITEGESRGSFNSTSFLGTGILDGENLILSTRSSYQKSSELLQSGPRLVWNGEKLKGLSAKPLRPRSFLIWDGRNHFGFGYADTASLQGLSNNLTSQPIPGFQIKYALNLDGGTSCDLWVSDQIPGGGLSKKSFFRKRARNYLVLKKR